MTAVPAFPAIRPSTRYKSQLWPADSHPLPRRRQSLIPSGRETPDPAVLSLDELAIDISIDCGSA